MSKLFSKPGVYFIMGSQNAVERDPLEILEAALAGGISCFQLREKGAGALTGQQLLNFAVECQRLCREYKVPFIVNDDVELARALDADGIHIGQEDMEANAARRLVGPDKILGVSVHSLEEAGKALLSGADYVGMGPVFGTQSKADAKSPAGISGIMAVKSRYPRLPVIGIGGITPDNAGQVWSAGADGVAVISAIAQAKNIPLQIRQFNETIKAGAEK
ncbi:thiamine phosphate synthase [Planococcus glaciei]|uniref:thiamine phosphate synthase n=1 Tax=Planococcus glaciei TaxID=459472 RepID=UPI001C72F656|nr:thiamine phosphate synthase [Planococcus glaciei]MBX0314567.1 thiamine phosphate synthase [Planococcus glaciei]